MFIIVVFLYIIGRRSATNAGNRNTLRGVCESGPEQRLEDVLRVSLSVVSLPYWRVVYRVCSIEVDIVMSVVEDRGLIVCRAESAKIDFANERLNRRKF